MALRRVRMVSALVSLAALVALMSACRGQTNVANANAQGEQLYQANCAGCHGIDAAGGISVGGVRSGSLRARSLDALYFNDTYRIARSILDGKDEEGKDLDAAMPRWRGKLSEAAVTEIINYLRRLR